MSNHSLICFQRRRTDNIKPSRKTKRRADTTTAIGWWVSFSGVFDFLYFPPWLKIRSIFTRVQPISACSSSVILFFRVRQKYQVFQAQADKNTKFTFRLDRSLFESMLFL